VTLPQLISQNAWYTAKRALAYLIDCCIAFSTMILVIQWLVLSQLRPYLGLDDAWLNDSIHLEMYVLLTISLPVWFYFTVLDSSLSKGTPGKRIMHISVVHQDGAARIDWKQNLLRTGLKLLPWELTHLGIAFPTPLYYDENPTLRLLLFVAMLLLLVYFYWILFSKNRQSPYDRMLHTRVNEVTA